MDPARAELQPATGTGREDIPLSSLLRDLAADGRRLVRDEIDLAKLELGRSARTLAADGALVGAGAVGALLGAACIVAALVIGLGVLIGSYWVSALVVGTLVLLVSGLILLKGVQSIRSARFKPRGTIDSLREDAAWVGEEVREIRRDWSRGVG